jgi:GNAT superfamily N-acetyltransferase
MPASDHAVNGPAFTISDLTVPERIDSPDAADFIAMAEVKSIVEAEQRGAGTEISTPEEMLPNWQDETSLVLELVAKVGGRVVACGSLALPVDAGECWASVSVLHEFRSRGIGSALYEHLEKMARCAKPGEDGQLPVHAKFFSARYDEAIAAADGYRTVTWHGRTPEDWLDGIALMRTRMSTDTPNACIEQTEDLWTADRVRSVDDLWAISPRVVLTGVALHEATGQLAGYTELDVPAESDGPVEQADTLVLMGHRGPRLSART